MTVSVDPPRPAALAEGEAPHAPRRGWAARWLGRFHVTGVFWFRLHAFGARRPEWMVAILVPLFTAFFFVTIRHIRRAVASNLVPVLGPCGFWRRQRRIWRTFLAVAWAQTERYERLFTERPFSVTMENEEGFRRALVAGGLVFLTGHVGNWETASALPVGLEGRRVHVVREEELDPEAQTFVAGLLRERLGDGYVTHFAAGDPLLGLTLREALANGEIVALQGDRPRRGGRTVEVELFGRPYLLPAGPAALARRTGAPLLPVFVRRTARRSYAVGFGEPFEVGDPESAGPGGREAELAEAGRRYAAVLERAVRAAPHQWFVFREIWAG